MIEINNIDGVLLRDMLIAGTTVLQNNREKVDALNVFPVPDGDTGTNMSLTIASAMKEVNQQEYIHAGEAAQAIAKGALKGARGNSGVILSQLFRGFAKELKDAEKITPILFANGLARGAKTAYKAVMKPKEGTILTVARVIAEEALKQAESNPTDFDALFSKILSVGEQVLKQTQNMLPALQQAGVVDSGGAGLMFIYTGFAAALRGEELPSIEDGHNQVFDSDIAEEEINLDTELKFIYSMDFIIQNLKDEVSDENIDRLKRRLNRVGDHVRVIYENDSVKIRVNTNEAGNVLQYALELGEINNVSIINLMQERRNKLAIEEDKGPAKKYGMMAVSLGSGFNKIYKDLGVDRVVDGGQTMNPSIDKLSNAINSINADNILVFPNNGNVIMACEQAAKISNKNVHVFRTKNVAMGIAAAIAFNAEDDVENNINNMTDASEAVRTGTITFSIRDTQYENIEIKKGDLIGLSNGKITAKGDNIDELAIQLIDSIITEDDELITIYYGEGVNEDDAKKVLNLVSEKYENCDVELQYGGQPLYYYLISVE